MRNKSKGWITSNNMTKDLNDKILILDMAGNLGLEQVRYEIRTREEAECN